MFLQINFPSGAYVHFNARNWGANIYVQVPSDDYQKTLGLCGTFDKNKDNDMVDKNGKKFGLGPELIASEDFSDSWK